MNKLNLFRNCSVSKEEFLCDYWHQKPLLIKNAVDIGDFVSCFPDKQQLIKLSCDDDIQSRIVFKNSETNYDVEYGPFSHEDFKELTNETWNLLVSDIDKWHPLSRKILQHFDFIRNWIFDDIMLSCGSVGGTVGPHTDHYDVFLLQVEGQRLWKFSNSKILNPDLLPDQALKLMSDFQYDTEYNLNPGDILYLPPEYAHYGIISSDDCVTCSIGMRTPSASELSVSFVDSLAQTLSDNNRFVEPQFQSQPLKGEITQDDLSAVKNILLDNLSFENMNLISWFGKYLTEYRSLFYEFNEYKESEEFNLELNLRTSPFSKTCYFAQGDNAILFVNGMEFDCSLTLAQLICNEQTISSEMLSKLTKTDLEVAEKLFCEGALIVA